ncbi:isochorismate synthase [Bacteroides sp. 519]|uniref:isochorismate synthase n=1 Tax=Bacteroides sp. 519 TaxID=2302937 RepID=UPI0013D01C4C|nr:isochorismate synthase [Bacteroides sp. 519]NDV58457.1 isochorismate synthase [Bacteroides sp. 519]
MTQSEFTIFLDDLVGQGKSFAVYRIPGDNCLNLIQQEEEPYTLSDFGSLNRKSGFVIAPFVITEKTPLVLLTGKEQRIEVADKEYSSATVVNNTHIIEELYRERFNVFITSLNNGELDKLVLSRKAECERAQNFSPGSTFLKACQWYIRSYVYLCHTPQTGTWLGCTPEIILSGEGQSWHTVALAGTQPLQNGNLPEVWDEKNKKEQALVAGYIKAQLNTLGITVTEKGPYTVRAAELAHLKSDFAFSLPNNDYLGDLLTLLHPTPAVCGLPKEKAYRFILENEGYSRRYYSGFIGMLDWEKGSNLYVNLRCMEILKDKLCLYAGGGLLPSSTLEEEWQETEDKLFTIKKVMSSEL